MVTKQEFEEIKDSLIGEEILLRISWFDSCGTEYGIGTSGEDYPTMLWIVGNSIMSTMYAKGMITPDELIEFRGSRPDDNNQ